MILLFIIYSWNTVTPLLEHTNTSDSMTALLATIVNKNSYDSLFKPSTS